MEVAVLYWAPVLRIISIKTIYNRRVSINKNYNIFKQQLNYREDLPESTVLAYIEEN
jgi:hypothetical protein